MTALETYRSNHHCYIKKLPVKFLPNSNFNFPRVENYLTDLLQLEILLKGTPRALFSCLAIFLLQQQPSSKVGNFGSRTFRKKEYFQQIFGAKKGNYPFPLLSLTLQHLG